MKQNANWLQFLELFSTSADSSSRTESGSKKWYCNGHVGERWSKAGRQCINACVGQEKRFCGCAIERMQNRNNLSLPFAKNKGSLYHSVTKLMLVGKVLGRSMYVG